MQAQGPLALIVAGAAATVAVVRARAGEAGTADEGAAVMVHPAAAEGGLRLVECWKTTAAHAPC